MTNKFWDLFEMFMAETAGEEKAAAFRAKAEAGGVKACDWRTPSFKRLASVLGIKHQLKALAAAEARHRELALELALGGEGEPCRNTEGCRRRMAAAGHCSCL